METETARALSSNLASLLRREHDSLAEFLVALATFDAERRWAELGHASLFAYLHRELRLSKGAAHYRRVAAELIQRVPAVVAPLRSGAVCFTSIVEVARVVTAENWGAVLPRFFGRSRREAAEVVAALQPDPAPPVRMVVTRVAAAARPVEGGGSAEGAIGAAGGGTADGGDEREPGLSLGLGLVTGSAPASPEPAGSPGEQRTFSPRPSPAPTRSEVVPLTAEQRRLHLTVSAAFLEKLERARAARPDLSEEELLDAGLDLVLRESEKRNGLVERPQQAVRGSKREHIPARVKREVWARDGGRCVFELASGESCGSTFGLQFDHVVPLARGGESTLSNTRLLCGAHNREAARRVLGETLMDRYCGRGRHRGEAGPRPAGDPP